MNGSIISFFTGNRAAVRVIAALLIITAWSCGDAREVADTILFNGKIVTVDSSFSTVGAVAIQDEKFIAVGSYEALKKYQGEGTELIDLEGRTVIPGLIDAHAHPIPASQSEYPTPIPDVHTIDEVLQWIRREARRKPEGEWIIHPKFFITRMEDMRQITLAELDAAAPRHPVFLNGSYGGMVNTRAFVASDITTFNHKGILKDPRTRKPTGLIRRSAFSLLKLPEQPTLSRFAKLQLLARQLHAYNSIGITSACSGGGMPDDLELFRALRDADSLTVRIFHNIRIPFDLSQPQERIASDVEAVGMRTGEGDEWVRVGALKVVLDGGMLTGTAFLHQGWGHNARALYGIDDPDYRGELMFTRAQLVKIINAAADAGWKFTAHVTGGGGVDTLLAAYEEANAKSDITSKRFSIIHGNFFTEDAIKQMARMNIYADVQPAWYFSDAELLHHVLGTARMETFHPYRALADAGIIMNGGSDHMVKLDPDLSINPYNPFTAMWSAVTRKTIRGKVYNADQRISREDALKMYTINNARASFEENIKGSIEVGKLADLVVLSHDILSCPVDSIRIIRPVFTMVGGRVVYRR